MASVDYLRQSLQARELAFNLREPLYDVVFNVVKSAHGGGLETVASRMIKVTFYFFVGLALLIPAGICYLAGKSISYFCKVGINRATLGLAPRAIELPQEIGGSGGVDLGEISRRFDLQIPNYRPVAGVNYRDRQDSLRRMCNSIMNQDPTAHSAPTEEARAIFYGQLTVYLRAILARIGSGQLDNDRIRGVLMELASASGRCSITWLQVAERLYQELYNQEQGIDQDVLRCVQTYKGDLALEFCQRDIDASWHLFNLFRNALGGDLGLSTEVSRQDIFLTSNLSWVGKMLFKFVFLEKYENIDRLVGSVHTQMARRECTTADYNFLVGAATRKGIPDPRAYVQEECYTEDLALTQAGVVLMLRDIRVLK